ncbi:thiamine transporter ThiT [Phenylobacterium haematophilum]|uniref:Thiamine transporter ThiT n=1 Tax=Phenylobacterium haematophilum TaxID=98513 RepID=A0A839ZZN3_9CAUL|nr:hypothetical protein [Phenylobacterium haematophilum]MBB3890577.1 thiamine transporter ThiT [Phenylobacterium haematophilum]
MTFALIFALAAVIFACWLLYTLATLALPVFAAMTLGMWVHAAGYGVMAALIVGLVSGILTLIAGQVLFALVRSPLWRLLVGLLFAVPAAIAGYHAVHGITAMGVQSEPWRHALGSAGALFIGAAAWLRIAAGGDVVRRIEQNAPPVG